MAVSGPGPEFDQFFGLPTEMQEIIASSLSENEAYRLVCTNPQLFLDNLERMPVLAEKFYNYLYNKKTYQISKESSEGRSGYSKILDYTKIEKREKAAQKMMTFIESFFGEKPKESEVQKITLDYALQEGYVQKYVTRLNLDFYSPAQIEDLIDNFPENSHVESLDLTDTEVTDDQLVRLLQKCPHLKELNIPMFNLENLDLPADLNLRSLETLNASGSDFPSRALVQFLQIAPIKNLNITGCTNLGDLDLPRDLDLRSLERVEAHLSNIPKEAVIQFLQQAVHLKYFDLSSCSQLGNLDLPRDLQLPNLRQLIISDPFLSSTVAQFMQKAPSLNNLVVSGVDLSGFVLPDGLSLASLKSFYANVTGIPSETIVQIFEKASQLTYFGLGSSTQLSDLDLPRDLQLESLRGLRVAYSDISSETLTQILERAPNLKSLSIFGCRQLADFDFSAYPDLTVVGP